MKSKKAQKSIDKLVDQLRLSIFNEHDQELVRLEIGDSAKEQLRSTMTYVAELAEQEAEERMWAWAQEFIRLAMKGISYDDCRGRALSK